MKLYRTAEGAWVGTQADAGNKNAIEVPTSKPELIAWLNQQAENRIVDQLDTPIDTKPTADQALGKCPKCKLTPAAATLIANGITLDIMCERIEKSSGIEIIRLTEAVVDRQQEFLREANSSRQSTKHRSQSKDGRHPPADHSEDVAREQDSSGS